MCSSDLEAQFYKETEGDTVGVLEIVGETGGVAVLEGVMVTEGVGGRRSTVLCFFPMENLNGMSSRVEVHPVGTKMINSSFLATGLPLAASEVAEKARIKVATTKIPTLSLLELVAPLVMAATAKEAKAINGEKVEVAASEMEVLTGGLVGLGVEALLFFGTKGSTSKLTVISGSVSDPEMVKTESSLFPSRSARR